MSQKTEKRKEEKKIHTYYEIEGVRLIRKLKKCPRCGAFMALHKKQVQRWTCGNCSYTDYTKPEKLSK